MHNSVRTRVLKCHLASWLKADARLLVCVKNTENCEFGNAGNTSFTICFMYTFHMLYNVDGGNKESINVNNSNKSGDFCGSKLPTSFSPLRMLLEMVDDLMLVCDIAHHVFLANTNFEIQNTIFCV